MVVQEQVCTNTKWLTRLTFHKELAYTKKVFLDMGICLSSSNTTPPHPGTKLNYTSSKEYDLSVTSSNASSLVHATSRTEGEILGSPDLKIFSFADLKACTRDFRPDSVLGGGGAGSVFKGWIDGNSFTAAKPGTGLVVAVKKLQLQSYQGPGDWLAEVNYLGQFDHPNLVKLIGYCSEDDHRLLVYEFLPRGSLENHIFRRGSYFQPLSWSLRLKVALGVAKGLDFLHSSEAKVIYRDFKTSNILLDSNYNAKLSDFGLAKDGPAGANSLVPARAMEAHRYAAPEYLATGHLTTKSDVYSYGVVLLELLSGRRAIDKNRPSGEHKLVEWAKPYLAHYRKFCRIMDNRLDGQYTMDVAQKVASLALQCISVEPKLRPTMDEIIKELEQLQDLNSTDQTRNRLRHRRRSAGDAVTKIADVSYPCPSASPPQ